MLESCRPEVKANMDLILDTYGGADGGIGFAKFCWLIESVDNKAQKGDASSELVIDIVTRFAKLIKFAQKADAFDSTGRLKKTGE